MAASATLERPSEPRVGTPMNQDLGQGAHIGRSRPAGVSPGAISFVGSWAVGFAIARLTGAAAVVLLLVAGFVAVIAASAAGWWRVRSIDRVWASGPTRADSQDGWNLQVGIASRGLGRTPFAMTLRPTGHPASDASTTSLRRAGSLEMVVDRAGTITSFSGWVGSTGTGGLIWWRRPVVIPVDPIRIAPRSRGPLLDIAETPTVFDGTSTGGRGPRTGDVNGVRPWRSGENNQAIHWPSTIRSRQLVARDHDPAVESRWTIPLDSDPQRLRWTIDEGLRHGHDIDIVAEDLAAPVEIRDADESAYWATVAADRQCANSADESRRPSIWSRSISGTQYVFESPTVRPAARWSAAAAAAIAVNMLLGALGDSVVTRLVATLGVVVGAALSVRFENGVAPLRARFVVSLLAVGALVRIAVQASGIGGLIEALRGPMPDLLMVLLVLHGAESANRRTVRVHLAITSVVVAYAVGLRIDDQVGWWMAAWGFATVWALASLTTDRADEAPERVDRFGTRRVAQAGGWTLCAAAVVLTISSFVPIPDGPASLGLPALSDDSAVIDQPGALVGPDGEPATGDTAPGDDPSRGSLGSVGGYLGFSETLDTSARGGLSDDIVMRVRAPEPAFWRGQTFADFDGRTWRVSPETGFSSTGPQINVLPSLGDLPFRGIETEEFVQTYNIETDLPNIVFAASRASTLIFDGTVDIRPDGALRADRTLTAGTIYTVVSQRVQVTPDLLRRQGDLGDRFDGLRRSGVDVPLEQYLELPESTSQRTIDLATELRVEGSTYDTILAYEAWLSDNTEYDLDAPVPAAGADAVDDFLFESQRGFCEQIASALVVMLRSQGVPARLATGYIPGERDRVSGVWKVRGRDAHAWVEVWFPETGWQAFDPTAFVPLAGEVAPSTVGGDITSAVIDGLTSRPVEIGGAVLLVLVALGSVQGIREIRRRRARGPWGILYDRFVALVPTGERSNGATAPQIAAAIARRLDGDATDADPFLVAATLDRVAFDPAFTPTSDDLAQVRGMVVELERADTRRIRTSTSS